MTRLSSPTFTREPRQVPDAADWHAHLGARLHSGQPARDLVARAARAPEQTIVGGMVAVDIEAAGLAAESFTVRCITAAWHDMVTDEVVSVLLDPRRDDDRRLAGELFDVAGHLVFHNAAYDAPPLHHLGVLSLDHVGKIIDTVVYARLAYPDRAVQKNLEKLAGRSDLLGLDAGGATMDQAFRARGYKNKADGFADADIDMPVYRLGALADTVVTWRLAPKLYDACVSWLTTSPFQGPTVPDQARAGDLIEREQVVNRAMLHRSARGLLVDRDYLGTYTEQTLVKREQAAEYLTAQISAEAVGRGDLVVAHLDELGALPSEWPRTATGRLQADKAALATLAHPLFDAHRTVADTDHVLDYLTKVEGMARITGRVHPQVNVLGASATGRMSMSSPELQQFPAEARGIIVADSGEVRDEMVSLDFKAIEPVVAANGAGDVEFLRGFNERGDDLYAPIVEHAGVDRKTAKVVVLAAMYGQGRKLLADTLGVGEDEAREIQRRVFSAMPGTQRFLENIRQTAEAHGEVMTFDGRRLPVGKDPMGKTMAYKGTNYVIQGSAYSVLAESIAEVARRGLTGGLYLAVHDELVVTAEVADEVRSIMETPPAWLSEFCGHVPVIRTDSHNMGGKWQYV